MGGKSNLLDPDQLSELSAESYRFRTSVENSAMRIYGELDKLNHLSMQRDLFGTNQEWVRQSVSKVSDNMAALRQSLERSADFIQMKLADLSVTDTGRKMKAPSAFATHRNLKK